MIYRPQAYPIYLKGYGLPRTPGLHLTDILRPMALTMRLFADSGDLDEFIEDTDPYSVGKSGPLMRCIIGYAWEEWLYRNVLKNVLKREFVLNGIIGTPDGIEEDEHYLILHEIKATYKTSARDFAENWKLGLWQTACYLKMISETMGVPIKDCRVVFHPLYLKGDYRGINPQYLPMEVIMEPEEVNGIWSTVERHRHLAQ